MALLAVESFQRNGKELVRTVQRRDGSLSESRLKETRRAVSSDLASQHDAAWLQLTDAPSLSDRVGSIDLVDVFAGCGGLTLGVAEACRALGLALRPRLAVDLDAEALGIYGRNFVDAQTLVQPVEELVAPTARGRLSAREKRLAADMQGVDLLIGGPPCQGHSNLNNHTRWRDPKNELYMSMARFCEVLRPKHVIIENVPGVEKDETRVAQRTWARLEELGYSVSSGVLDASEIGAAQVRKRSVTIASRVMRPSVPEARVECSAPPRPVSWAIGDLLAGTDQGETFDSPSQSNAENRRRIDYLFDNDLYNLPDDLRPDCHRLKRHSYTPMYGRLRWNAPSPTITTGFGSMGRGRFVHPIERRLITPHEAARIQGFPDFFDFGPSPRGLLHKVVGNAVPPRLGYAVGLHLLR